MVLSLTACVSKKDAANDKVNEKIFGETLDLYATYYKDEINPNDVEQNKASGPVMEKCGLHFVKYGQFQKLDGSNKMRSMEYEGEIDAF